MRGEPVLDHVIALTDDVGIAQHASHDVPKRTEGYCTDDVARAFVVANVASTFDRRRDDAIRLGRTYLAFLAHARIPDGRLRNFMSYDRTWLDDAGTPDSNGRALWAFGHGMRFAPLDGWRRICAEALDGGIDAILATPYVRSRAYAALGLAHAFDASDRSAPRIEGALRAIGEDLAARNAAVDADREWDWFDNELTYDNARLPEAMIRIGAVLGDERFAEIGLRTLRFYESVVIEDGRFVPIGNDGWYRRGGPRSRFGQQPLEAAAVVDAGLAAESYTGDPHYRGLAETAFDWFYGRNTSDAVMVSGGGCCDGLEAFAVNRNMGAESTLAYVSSAFALARAAPESLRLLR